jgi:MFS family permease
MNKYEKQVLFLASITVMFEFYDFSIMIMYSREINETFFAISNAYVSNILTLILLVSGYAARIVGAIYFGRFGDLHGRKTPLLISSISMGIITVLIGLLPGYLAFGIMMPILLIVLRVLQGIFLGGDIPGMIVFALESTKNYKVKFSSIMIISVIGISFLFSNIIHSLLNYIIPIDFILAPWRIAFIIGGVLSVIMYFARLNLKETVEFDTIKNKSKTPVKALLKSNYKKFIWSVCASFLSAFSWMSLLVLPKLYCETMNLSPPGTIENITAVISYIFGAFLCINIHKILNTKLTFILPLLLIVPVYFLYIDSLNMQSNILFYTIIFSVLVGSSQGILYYFAYTTFDTNIRYTAIALNFAIITVVATLCQIFILNILNLTHMKYTPVYFYIVARL